MKQRRFLGAAAADLAGQQQIVARIQQQTFVDVPFLPLGPFFQSSTRSRTLEGGLKGISLFWGVRRAG